MSIIDLILKEARIHTWSKLQDQQTNNMVYQFVGKYKNELVKNVPEDKIKEKLEEVKKQYLQIANQLNNHIINQLKDNEVDFKNQKVLLMWLLLQVFQGDIVESRIDEDSSVIKDNIILYYKNRKEIGKSLEEINYGKMKKLVSKYRGKEDTSEKYREFLTKPDFIAGEYKIYKVTDIDVCLKVGKGTSWCIQGKKWAKKYLDKGPLWLITKNGQKYALFSFEENQFMDVHNNELDVKTVKDILSKWSYGRELLEKNIKMQGDLVNLIKFIDDNPSEEVQLAAIEISSYCIEYIKDPSEKVQLAAVQKNGQAIQFIKNPSGKVQLAAVKEFGLSIRYIKNPSEEVQLAAVKQIDRSIQFIKNPSEKVQLEAVRKNGYAIRYIKEPSEEVQLEAVEQVALSIRFIKNPTQKVKDFVKKQNGDNPID